MRLKSISSGFMGGLRIFGRSSTGVSGKFQWCFKDVLKMFKVSFKSVSRKFQGCLRKAE